MSTSGHPTTGTGTPFIEHRCVDTSEPMPEVLDHNVDVDDLALLETMLAKAARLAHELQDTSSFAAASSRAYDEYPASSTSATVNQHHLPEAIELKDHGTECSSIGNGISVGQIPLQKSTAFVDTHRLLASMGSTPIAMAGVNDDSTLPLPRVLADTRIDSRQIHVDCHSRTTDDKDKEAPIPALVVTTPLARAANEPATRLDVTTVSVPDQVSEGKFANVSSAEQVFDSLPITGNSVESGTKSGVHIQTQPMDTVELGETSIKRSDKLVRQGENYNEVAEERKTEMPSLDMPVLMHASENFRPVECCTATFGGNAKVHDTLAASLKSATILSVSTNSNDRATGSFLNVHSSQSSYGHTGEQKFESYRVEQQTLSTQVTPVSSNTTSPWVEASFATEVDEDYAPVADYIKWERVTSARQGDDDFVPLSDYISPANAQRNQSLRPELQEMTYFRHRAAIRQRRKQRRRRLVAFVIMLPVSIGTLLFWRLYSYPKMNQTIQMQELVVSETLATSSIPSEVEVITDLAYLNPHLEERMSETDAGIYAVIESIENAIAVIDSSARPGTQVSLRPLAFLKATIPWSAHSHQERRILVEDLIASMMQ